MEYTYLPIADTTLFEIRTQNIIFTLDSADEFYSKLFSDFEDVSKLEYFVSLLQSDPSTAFDIYMTNG